MAKPKITISFSVSQEVAERVKTLFPNGRTEEVLIHLLDLYENPPVIDNSENEKYREIVESITEMYDAKASDLVDVLETEKDSKLKLYDSCDELNAQIQALNDEKNVWLNMADRLKEKCEALELDNQQIHWEKIRATLQPFAVALLEKTVIKLSKLYNRDVQPMEILVDMFVRYTVERWNQWFYPFQLTDAEILSIAREINPEITSISQIKKTLPQ